MKRHGPIPEPNDGFPNDVLLLSSTLEGRLPPDASDALESACRRAGFVPVHVNPDEMICSVLESEYCTDSALISATRSILHPEDLSVRVLGLLAVAEARGNCIGFLDDSDGRCEQSLPVTRRHMVKLPQDPALVTQTTLLWLLFASRDPAVEFRSFVHGARNPLVGIQFMLETIDRMVNAPEKLRERLSLARKCLGSVFALMELLRGDVEDDVLRVAPGANLADIVEQSVRLSHDLAPSADVRFSSGEGDDKVQVSCNRPLLWLAISELIQNAWKASPDNAPVTVQVHLADDSRPVVAVRNRTNAIDRRLWEVIEQPLPCIINWQSGLEFVRKVMAFHGGKVSAQKLDPDQLVISLTFPI